MAGDLTISTINGGAIGAKNAIINGNFGINQRAVSGTVTLSAGVYGHDRFKAGASGCTYTFATSNNITTLTITAGSLIQVIEGINLQSGTYTLSWTGTAQGKIGGGSYAGSGVTGTVTGGTNLNIEFDTGTLSLVQLEAGSVATPFEHRQYGLELALCQRYYQRWQPGNSALRIANGNSASAIIGYPVIPFAVQMRVVPTATNSAPSDWSLIDGSSPRVVSNINPPSNNTEWWAAFTCATGLITGRCVQLRSAASGAWLAVSAEL